MTALVVFCLETVSDRAAMARYREEGRGSLVAHGARFVAGSAIEETLEGAPLDSAVVLEFPSVEVARAWYGSPEYQQALAIRLSAAACRAFILKGRD